MYRMYYRNQLGFSTGIIGFSTGIASKEFSNHTYRIKCRNNIYIGFTAGITHKVFRIGIAYII